MNKSHSKILAGALALLIAATSSSAFAATENVGFAGAPIIVDRSLPVGHRAGESFQLVIQPDGTATLDTRYVNANRFVPVQFNDQVVLLDKSGTPMTYVAVNNKLRGSLWRKTRDSSEATNFAISPEQLKNLGAVEFIASSRAPRSNPDTVYAIAVTGVDALPGGAAPGAAGAGK
ncbi:hypothetical protein [Roseibium sp. RKSG952]|uniref:hypothetical protein n=1 Tax=Roseibium sp. RKSG952 TaxID=2529384 RepID=UPI0012BC47D3|nr:hypothetical protein [Roseibium sp. RKSG952]MTH95790.1 hypothetical protein [Roseibium sp. RKSG952]